MQRQLKSMDILALGFMLFAFFLGAGNIIFPPLAGLQSGNNLLATMGGFLTTAVGLPLLSIIAIAFAGGGWIKLSQDLPTKIAIVMAVLFYIIIGPAFAAPRTGLVAYEMGIKPFIAEPAQIHLALFSIVFFMIAMIFSWYPGKLLDMIGKLLTPILFLGLILLSVMVILYPQGEIMAAQADYAVRPFATGFLDGYNTMDTFGALMFGVLVIETIRSKGIKDQASQTKYLIIAALIAALGLAFVYISLFYLGATSANVAAGADNGGVILSAYVQALFGNEGQFVLSVIVLIACLTTAIGLISSCAEYFSELSAISYKYWVLIIGCICALVANVGLAQLIKLSVPVLYALYPVAITTVVLTFLRRFFVNPKSAYRIIVSVSFVFALIDAAKSLGLEMGWAKSLPLFDYGMAWLLPTVIVTLVLLVISLPKLSLQKQSL